jgi:hypothetical protein
MSSSARRSYLVSRPPNAQHSGASLSETYLLETTLNGADLCAWSWERSTLDARVPDRLPAGARPYSVELDRQNGFESWTRGAQGARQPGKVTIRLLPGDPVRKSRTPPSRGGEPGNLPVSSLFVGDVAMIMPLSSRYINAGPLRSEHNARRHGCHFRRSGVTYG